MKFLPWTHQNKARKNLKAVFVPCIGS